MGVKRVIFTWSYIAILWLIIAPFIMYCCYRLYEYRYHPAVSNRLWRASLLAEIAVLGIIIINRPLTAFINLLQYTDHIIAVIFSTLTWAVFFYFVVYIFAYRIWFLHYKTNFSLSIEQQQWKAIINKSKWGNTWYLQNINRYGNERWVAKRVLLLYIVVVTAHATIYVITLNNMISQGFLFMAILPPLIFDFWLLFNTSKSNDIFFVRYELNYIMFLTILALIASIITTIFGFDEKWYTDLIADSVGVWYSLFFTIIQTYLVLTKCKLLGQEPITISLTSHTQKKYSINFKSIINHKDNGDDEQYSSVDSTENIRKNTEYSANNAMKRYFKTINEEMQFNLFCLHLTKEWSIENMVGFIEFAQLFRALIIHKPSELELYLGLLIEYKFENVEELPKSDIIFDHEKYPKISTKIIALYNKYIVYGCDFQLNLSSQVRAKWIEAIGALTNTPNGVNRRMSAFGRRISSLSAQIQQKQKRKQDNNDMHHLPNIVEMPSPENIENVQTSLCSEMKENENKNEDKNNPLDDAINFVREITLKRKKLNKNNEWLQMNITDDIIQDTINPFENIEIDCDLNIFLPLIQRILEQCHLLLMDSYSRFKNSRDRKVEYDMKDDQTVKSHTVHSQINITK